jgi:hypothetical protein
MVELAYEQENRVTTYMERGKSGYIITMVQQTNKKTKPIIKNKILDITNSKTIKLVFGASPLSNSIKELDQRLVSLK